jgi:hypothetical protein
MPTWCQCHQHFIRAFYVRTSFQKLFLVTYWLWQTICAKNARKNIDEIDRWCQFNQHFMREFFVRKCFAQLFSSYM